MGRPLRVALLSYRSKPHCGGQGVYVRHLSRELAAQGHHVEVFSGQPYPDLDPGPVLRKVPSLDLYRDDDPFRTPRLREYRDWTDVVETATMWTGGFPEPFTFSIRALRALSARRHDFDIVHDNQGLGYGLLGVARLGLPLVTSIHHPISVDKRIDLESSHGLSALGKRRWYGFVRMQARVARRAGPVITVSESSKHDICRDFRIPPENVHIVPLGVDTRVFHPRDRGSASTALTGTALTGTALTGTALTGSAGTAATAARVRGRIVAVASADSPVKGVATLLRAVAKLVTERDVHLIVIGKLTEGGTTQRLTAQLSLTEHVTFTHDLAEEEFAGLLASAEIAVVPSLYEGFSLPAVEYMASGTPLIASRAGALPEVTGDTAELVTPGDAEELAATLRRLHDSPPERSRLADLALRRVRERYAWPAVATATAARYRSAICETAASADTSNDKPADPGENATDSQRPTGPSC